MDSAWTSRNALQDFQNLGETYSRAEAVYVEWNTDVNLGPPAGLKERSQDTDPHVHTYYNSLQYSLFETNRPETFDRTRQPRTEHTKEQIAVAVLSSPVECLSILLEGGRQFPDGVHLILSPHWLTKVPSPTPGLWTLLIHKAITFHRDGFTYIDEFDPPRKCTYLLNYFTYNITGGHRADGNEIEKDLDCPMSSSVQLAALVDDKVWTRIIMADVGLHVPETLAFYFRPLQHVHSDHNHIRVVELENKDELNLIRQEVTDFLHQRFMNDVEKIVVKPSWPNSFGSIGVTYHRARNVDSIVDAIVALWCQTPPGSAVLIESFIDTISPDKGRENQIQWTAQEDYGFRARSTVCRDFDNVPVTTMISCGMGLRKKPINGDNSVVQTLDTTLMAYNVTDDAARASVDNEIRVKSQETLRVISNKEKMLSSVQKGTRYGETELIGIDLVITNRNNKLVPYGIEVNSHDCTINCQILENVLETLNYSGIMPSLKAKQPITYTELKDSTHARGNIARRISGGCAGKSVRPFVRTMFHKSQLHVMRGKRILVVGAGGYSKRFIWPAAQDYNIQIVLIDPAPHHIAAKLVWKFFTYDFNDHTNDRANARNIIHILRNADVSIDGCVTFWEDCVPLAALINEWMNLPGGAGFKSSLTAKEKSLTQNTLYGRRDDIPHWPRTYLYASPAITIRDNQDLENAATSARYPAMLKLEHGSSAVGVTLVNDGDELKSQYSRIVSRLTSEKDFPGIGLGHSNRMLVVEYHPGSEHDVDVVIFNRKLVAAFISDNGPTRFPLCTETAALMPSSLPPDKQAQLITAAYQSCTDIGLSSGTFNVELKMTPTGPKLIEINARMGGFYLRDWIKNIYGVDLALYSLMTSCNVKPHVPRLLPSTYMMDEILLMNENYLRISCGMGLRKKPINGDNSVVQTLDTTLMAYNVTDDAARASVDNEIRVKSQETLRVISNKEKMLSSVQKGTRYGETELIGIDLVITNRNNKLVPYGIEVNSHDCTINCQILENVLETLNYSGIMPSLKAKQPITYTELKDSTHARGNIARRISGGCAGKSVRPFVRTMFHKSQLHVMRGKRILVVGAGGYSKRFIWPAAQDYNIQIVLIDPAPHHIAAKLVWKFFTYDFNDHTNDRANARNIIHILRNADVSIDGCVTFWEDCVPLAALINEWMNLPGGAGFKSSLTAKEKSLTQNTLYGRRDDIPHWPRTYLYASPAITIRDNQDLENAATSARYPAMLKLEHGSSAVGVTLVNDGDELKSQYSRIVSRLTSEKDFPGIGLGHSNRMLVVEYHPGSEHDVDVVIFNRKLVAAFISDNGPTRFPLCTETAALMPSSLPPDKQAQLITAAYQSCTDIGLSSGTFNVELKMTPTGPKLIEINARMGGFYLRDWIKNIYGVDLALYSLMTSCNVKPHVPRLLPSTYMMGIMLVPSLHRHVLEDEETFNNVMRLHDLGKLYFSQFSEDIDDLNTEFEEPFGNIAVYGKTVAEVKERLMTLSEEFGISHEDYNIAEFTKYF